MKIIFWLLLTFIFVSLEIFIPSLITIWFALASVLTIFLSFFFADLKIQIFFFSISSIFFIIFTRPYAKKFLSKNKENFNSSMVGDQVIISKIIDINREEKIYEVKFKGTIWTALSTEIFTENDIAYIVNFKGNKIIISNLI